MQRWHICLMVITLLLASTSLVAQAGIGQNPASQSGTVLKVAPSALKLNVGETATFDLTIEQVEGLYGIEVYLKFDPKALEIVDADPDKEGVQLQAGMLPAPDFVVLNEVDNVAGTADYAVIQLPPNQPGQGDGIVASITVRAKEASNTQIRIDRFTLADTAGKSIKAMSQHSQVQVGGDPAWLLVAVAAFLIVAAGVTIGFFVIKRK